jgi:ABC-2 type transport system permease protein
MRVVDIALKDITEVVRDRKSALFLILMPVVFTLFFGFAFAASDPDPRLPVGVLDQDRAGLSAPLTQLLSGSEAVRLVPLQAGDEAAVDAMVRDGKLSAAIVVPPGFADRTLAGVTVPVTIIAPASPAGQTAGTAISSAVKRLLGAVEAARLATQAAEQEKPFADDAARRQFLAESVAAAQAGWQGPDVSVASQVAGVPSTAPKIASGFTQSSPGMMVMFAVFSLITSASVLAVERRAGTLQRMLTTPLSRGQIIAGHALAMGVLVLAQEVLLVLLGQLAFGVNYLGAPVATLLMMVVLAFWAASVGLLIGAGVRHEQQVVMYSLIAMFIFSALGGAWFPLAIAGKAFSTIGHVMPTAWALDGFQNIILRGEGLGGVVVPAAIVLAYAVFFYLLALWRFRFE